MRPQNSGDELLNETCSARCHTRVLCSKLGVQHQPALLAARLDEPSHLRCGPAATEWRTLYTYLRRYVKEAQDKRRHRERFYLQHYILILVNSGIRIGEARHLRWRDISSTKTLSGQKRLIFTVRGKTGEREVVCNETVKRYVEQLQNFRSEEVKMLNLEEPIFCHPNGRPIGSFKKGFEQALNEAGVLRSSNGSHVGKSRK